MVEIIEKGFTKEPVPEELTDALPLGTFAPDEGNTKGFLCRCVVGKPPDSGGEGEGAAAGAEARAGAGAGANNDCGSVVGGGTRGGNCCCPVKAIKNVRKDIIKHFDMELKCSTI